MDNRLHRLVLEAIIDRWQQGERAIASEDVYTQLVNAGEQIPEGAMAEIFEDLESRGLIRGPGFINSDGIKTHGSVVVTWVNPDLL